MHVSLLILSVFSACWLGCPTGAQYPECPRSASAGETDRVQIEETSKKFIRVLERFQNRPVEIVFVLDSSGSITEDNFGCEVQFVRQFSKLFSVSEETSRMAVVTYSDCDKIYTDVDYINNPTGKNKCTLLGIDLPEVVYQGGGTCTAGAINRARDILAGSRQSKEKIVFVLTDGQSNDRPATLTAAVNIKQTATVFAIGLGTGIDQTELNGIATTNDHVFLLGQLTDVEKLADRVLGDQSDMASWDRKVSAALCNSLCTEGQDCCDVMATCSCATQTGSYGCACHPGYTGDGKVGQCNPCPRGTYKPQYGNQGCMECPAESSTEREGSTAIGDCQCADGHVGSPEQNKTLTCTPVTCGKLIFGPSSGVIVVPSDCGNQYGTECQMQCLPNYRAQPGTADTVRCTANSSWSDDPLQCTRITCEVLQSPTNGRLSCDSTDWAIDTICTLTCDPGYEREGDLERRCDLNAAQQIGEWSNNAGTCKAKTCPALLAQAHMKIRPDTCLTDEPVFNTRCGYDCDEGYELRGVSQRTCQADSTWSNATAKSACVDVEPPKFTTCPGDVSLVAELKHDFAMPMWEEPSATDNSGRQPDIVPSTVDVAEWRFYLGQVTEVTYTARDEAGLASNCTFRVTVKDQEAPMVTYCPNNIGIESREPTANVNWTEPTFKDNSGQPVRLKSNRSPPSVFTWGLAQLVTYQAQDSAGNNATCEFTVAVKAHSCPYHPPPLNGALACEKWLGGQFCSVSCNENFDFYQKPQDRYFCKVPPHSNQASWAQDPSVLVGPIFKMPWPDCTEKRDPRAQMRLEVEFFTGSCDQNATAEIAQDFVRKMDQVDPRLFGFCEVGCSMENVNVTCGRIQARRRRRDADDLMIEIQFTVFVDPKDLQGMNESVADQPITSVQVMEELVNTIDAAISTGQLDVAGPDGNLLSPAGPASVVRPLTLSCLDGEVLRNESCVACPPGTHYDVKDGICQDCSPGFYQDTEGQLTCLRCPDGTTTSRAISKNLRDCKAPCSMGTYSTSGLETCMACPQGTYQPSSGATSCLSCPDGLTTWTEGAFSMDECSGECPIGRFSNTGYAPCSPCPKGTYQPSRTQTSCIACPDGTFTHYEGAHALGYCQVINECDSKEPVCKNGGSCVDLPMGYLCQCLPGYAGQDCAVDIDDCDHDLCQNNGTCRDMVAGFRCECVEGFVGEHCQTDVDDCESDPCFNNAVCIDGPNSYRCECVPGFTGDMCQVNLFDCASNPCQNEGTCVDLAQNFTCCCRPGYRGRHCEILVDHCQPSPCQNDATCVAGFNSATCHCQAGFTGERCEVELNECELQDVLCQHGGTCQYIVNGFQCRCTPGYSGIYCQSALSSDFDLQFTQASTSNFVLMEDALPDGLHALTLSFWMRTVDKGNAGTPFSYATRGPDGRVQDNAFTISDYNSVAVILNGQFLYTDQKLNSDYDWHHVAFTWNSMDGHWAMYVDRILRGSDDGFMVGAFIRGSGALVLGQEQDSFAGSFAQTQSFIGDLSQVNMWDYAMTQEEISVIYSSCAVAGNVLAWSQARSSIHGDVYVIPSSNLCAVINQCQPSTCQNHGTCTDLIGSFECHCALGYHGTNCEMMSTGCISDTCLNGGSCHSNGSLVSCSCTSGFSGGRCEQSDPCLSVTCLNRGTCVNGEPFPECICPAGFTGRVCEYDVNECDHDNGGCTHTCQNTQGSFTCSCPSGYALQPDGRSCNDVSYCVHEGRFHLANDVWSYKCSTCRCEQGATVCEAKQCADIRCKENEYEYQGPDACCPQCLKASKTCTVTRDGNHISYDGNRYEHRGNCRYVLSQDCIGSQFTVEVKYEANKKKIRRWALWLRLDCVEVEVASNGSVKVTGEPVELPYVHAEPKNVRITPTNSSVDGGGVLIETNRGLVIRWTRLGAIQVSAPGSYADQLCGLCGNMNGNRKDDRTTRQFLPARSAREFAHSWKVDGYKHCAIPKSRSTSRLAFGAISNDKISACSGLHFTFLRDVRKKCSMLRQRSFHMCHAVVKPTRYFEWCMQDACTCNTNEPCHCEAITAYMYECQRNNVDVTLPPGNPCNTRCPEGLIYDHCGPACLPTCDDPNPSGPRCISSQCTPRCQCPAGTVLHDNTCILPSYCPVIPGE